MDKPKRVPITKEQIARLKAERQRTGVSPLKLISGSYQKAPIGLSPSLITGWLTGNIDTAKKGYVEWVLDTYASILTERIMFRLASDDFTKLHTERKRTGYGAKMLLSENLNDVPFGLNVSIVNSWLSCTTESAQRNLWDFVIEAYSKLPAKPSAQ